MEEFTKIKEKEEGKKEEKRGRKPKKDAVEFSYEELQEKFSRSFNAISYFLKSDKVYKEEDFEEEAKDLSRLAKKYPILADVLTILDPLFLVLGLFSKLRVMLENAKKKKEDKKDGDKVDTVKKVW